MIRQPLRLRPFRPGLTIFFSAVLLLMPLAAETNPAGEAPSLAPVANIALYTAGPMLRESAQPQKPFTVAGERGVLLGQQDGTFEAWVLPVKLLSNLRIEANVQGYPVPIDVNAQAAQIEVRPDRTVLTYTHIAFTVRQIMFSPNDAPAGTGPVVLFEFDCLHPTDFTLRFTPELRWMWPERNAGTPGVEWVERGGFYVLHSDYPDFGAAVAIPGATPGILAPYQERPQIHPVEFKLHIDPTHDRDRMYPLLMAMGASASTATDTALGETLERLNAAIPALYARHAQSYHELIERSTRIETPDKHLNEAFQWGVVSIEQLKALAQPTEETALVAGYYVSGDSARPGFGWFFGRDALYTLYAVNGYGNFSLSRDELEFLIRRQRADGKIMHEYSQTAPDVNWLAFPYMYAAADATPLFLLAVADYVRASGDTSFLMRHRDAVEKAWAFETDPAHDTDHDGIYDNSQGTGWVESWPGGMPHQEVYLALLDEEASVAYRDLGTALKNPASAAQAATRASTIHATIEREYADVEKGCYAFSHGMDGKPDRTRTVYPAIAWWDETSDAAQPLAHAQSCLQQFAAHTLATDWGLRDVASDEPIFNVMSYHQGSVWPLFTGWASMAEYRGGQPLVGEQLLMQNVHLTWASDLGAVTELLSGDTYVPFGRSTSHQLWSSAMVAESLMRGMLGVTPDAEHFALTVDPHLPADWPRATVENLHLGARTVRVTFERHADGLQVTATAQDGARDDAAPALRSDLAGAHALRGDAHASSLLIPLPAVELVNPIFDLPEAGARSATPRVLAADYAGASLELTLQAPAGTQADYALVVSPKTHPAIAMQSGGGDAKIESAEDGSLRLHTEFAQAATGWQTMHITLHW